MTAPQKTQQNTQVHAISSQVVQAASEMTSLLSAGLSPADAAKIISKAALKGMEIKRVLCLLRDPWQDSYIGHLKGGGSCKELTIPSSPTEIKAFLARENVSDIEFFAYFHLALSLEGCQEGEHAATGMIDIRAGCGFRAAYFPTNEHSHWTEKTVLGGIIVDFFYREDELSGNLARLPENFMALSLVACNAVERLLLADVLLKQSGQMAERSRTISEQQKQLFHLHRLATVGQLAASAAHEINNPLTIISLNLQILNRLAGKFPAGGEMSKRLQVIADQEERISKITNDLLGLARPGNPQVCHSSVREIVGNVLEVLGDRVSMTGITIDNRIPATLPRVLVDPKQLEQVLMNLLINANHAMPNGGSIRLTASPGDELMEIRIEDSGTGIPDEDLIKIFDPFFSSKPESQGTGLGLAISRSLVEHNKGSLHAESRLGEGTAFTIRLPLDRGRLSRRQEAQQKPKAAVGQTASRQRILVIDDEILLNEILQETLTASGYEVEGAYDGMEGMDKLRNEEYHLVLLDIRMPCKNGFEVLDFISAECAHLKIVVITGHASDDEMEELVANGVHACLRKPFQLEEALATIDSALQGS